MSRENIERFKVVVLKAMAALYSSHPAEITVDGDAIGQGSSSEEIAGTLKWLIANGFVNGKLVVLSPRSYIGEAMLSARGLRVLEANDAETSPQPLGAAVAVAAFQGGSEAALVADVLYRRLLSA